MWCVVCSVWCVVCGVWCVVWCVCVVCRCGVCSRLSWVRPRCRRSPRPPSPDLPNFRSFFHSPTTIFLPAFGAAGASHNNTRTPNVHISGPGLQKTPPNSTKGPPREGRKKETCGRKMKKARNFGPPFGAPPFGTLPFGPVPWRPNFCTNRKQPKHGLGQVGQKWSGGQKWYLLIQQCALSFRTHTSFIGKPFWLKPIFSRMVHCSRVCRVLVCEFSFCVLGKTNPHVSQRVECDSGTVRMVRYHSRTSTSVGTAVEEAEGKRQPRHRKVHPPVSTWMPELVQPARQWRGWNRAIAAMGNCQGPELVTSLKKAQKDAQEMPLEAQIRAREAFIERSKKRIEQFDVERAAEV